ncbi:ribbon-helix-helix domain-containing protein [Candidatus Woesearchaeota archaeon]|nr:ribbon-helix-helix domain-containing protein [Candidatus Woesearchaeota archaeon]
MEAIPAKLTPKMLEEIDEIIHDGWYANRSELIRDAIREMVKRMKAERLEAAIKDDVKWGLYGKD